MDKEQQEKAIDALRDWSKWLIGLDFIAGAGCIIVLQGGVGPGLRLLLVMAIVLFALSAVAAALITGILAAMVQRCPVHDEAGNVQSIYRHPVWRGVSLGLLVRIQFVLFALGILHVLGWVALRPPAA